MTGNGWVHLFILILSNFVAPVFTASAQDPVTDEIAKIVYLDSIVVKASQSEFSVADFIDLVRKDESFYLAFRNLRATDYFFSTRMHFQDRKGKECGSYSSTVHQVIDTNNCRYQQILDETSSGKFYKRKRRVPNFYTYELFERLFILDDTTCNVSVQPQRIDFDGEGMEGHVAELKKLIFTPGTQSDVPLIGNKTEVFSDKMRPRYDFFISSGFYGADSMEAYVFRIKIKPEFEAERNNKTVIKDLTTFFSKKDFQVLGRSFQLAHYKPLYQFSVDINIRLIREHGLYLPSEITYMGFWNIPFKQKETGDFKINFSQFK